MQTSFKRVLGLTTLVVGSFVYSGCNIPSESTSSYTPNNTSNSTESLEPMQKPLSTQQSTQTRSQEMSPEQIKRSLEYQELLRDKHDTELNLLRLNNKYKELQIKYSKLGENGVSTETYRDSEEENRRIQSRLNQESKNASFLKRELNETDIELAELKRDYKLLQEDHITIGRYKETLDEMLDLQEKLAIEEKNNALLRIQKNKLEKKLIENDITVIPTPIKSFELAPPLEEDDTVPPAP
jgi:hypothetical protein